MPDSVQPEIHIIVEVLRDYGYVDARGMGVRTKVIPALKAVGIEPLFDVTDDYLKTTIKQVKGQPDLIKVILENPKNNYQQFADRIGVSAATIKRHIQKLKEAGILFRIGSRKTGYWEVKEK